MPIGPHPDFTPSQKRVVAKDYGMEEGEFWIHLRQALLYSLRKRLGLDAGHGVAASHGAAYRAAPSPGDRGETRSTPLALTGWRSAVRGMR